MAQAKRKDNVIDLHTEVQKFAIVEMARTINNYQSKEHENHIKLIRTLLKALQLKDNYTFEHSARVAFYSLRAGLELGLDEKQLNLLELSAVLHDIGKIGIPDNILQKPSRLEENEFLIMKTHPEKSFQIMTEYFSDSLNSEEIKSILDGARHHHERFDGRGYPKGFKGEDIPLFARIILIADTFDAMTSTRPYRKGLSYEIAFAELKEFAGSQFDPKIVEKFITAMGRDKAKGEAEFTLSFRPAPFKKDAA